MTLAKEQLRSIIERIERLEEEKKAIADDIRDVYLEAKSNGYDVKALRTIIKMRKVDKDERAEQEAIVESYAHALGMLADTPLGEAAIKAATNPPARIRATRERVRQPSTEEDRQAACSDSPQMAGGGSDNDPLPAMPPAVPHKPQDMTDVPFLPADDGLEIPAELRRARG